MTIVGSEPGSVITVLYPFSCVYCVQYRTTPSPDTDYVEPVGNPKM